MATKTTSPTPAPVPASERVVLPAGVWAVDEARSEVRFHVRKLGLYDVHGRFRRVKGEIEVDAEGLPRRGEVVVDAASITTRMPPRDWHLRARDFLGVKDHPRIRIGAHRIEAGHDAGLSVLADFEIHGQSGRVPLRAAFEPVADEDPRHVACIRLQGRLDRRQFGIKASPAFEWVAAREIRLDVRLALHRVA